MIRLKLKVSSDPDATADKVLVHIDLLRLSSAADLMQATFALFVAFTLYRLLEHAAGDHRRDLDGVYLLVVGARVRAHRPTSACPGNRGGPASLGPHGARRLPGCRRSAAERSDPDAHIAQGEAVQVPGPPVSNSRGLISEQSGELPLETRPWVVLDDLGANFIR